MLDGLLAPCLLLGSVLVPSDAVIMQNQQSSMLWHVTVGITTSAVF